MVGIVVLRKGSGGIEIGRTWWELGLVEGGLMMMMMGVFG